MNSLNGGMTTQEFNDMLDKLYKLGLADGDLGYAYWYNVIQELIKMRDKTHGF